MENIENQLTRVRELSLQDKPEEALALVNTLDDTGDMGGMVCFARGNIYMQLEQFALADECYNLAVGKGFVDFRLYMNLASVNMQMDKIERAELFYRQAAELDATQVIPLSMICEMRLQLGDLNGAMAVAEEMAQRHPTLIDGFKLNLTIMLELGMYQEAMGILSEIENRFSAHPDYILLRSFVVSKLETANAAMKYLEEKESCFFESEAKLLYTQEKARLLLSRAVEFLRASAKDEYRAALQQAIDVLNSAGDALGLEMRLMRISVYEELEQYADVIAALDTTATFLKESKSISANTTAILDRIAEKRSEVSAKIGLN